MEILLETYHRLLDEIKPLYHRKFYDEFKPLPRLVGVVGARGVGKTTFLLHYLRENYGKTEKALYVSADHLFFSENSLLDLVDSFYKEYAGELLCIDEIHRYENWNQELKNIFDAYPKIRIIFSGSSSINLIKGKYDLSRRASLQYMYGFSFREYLELKLKTSFPVFSFKKIIEETQSTANRISSTPKLLGYLKEYLREGYYPIFTELKLYQAYREALIGIIDKTIFEDISSFYSLKTKNLDTFRKILYFIATSAPGSININKLAKSLGKDHTTISEYLEMLRESSLLRYLLKDKRGHALVRNAEKIYLDNTNLIYAINDTIKKSSDIGLIRELFVISQLENAGHKVFYSDEGDIKCEDFVLEIGGKGKSQKGRGCSEKAILVRDDILIGGPKDVPLYLFGFLS